MDGNYLFNPLLFFGVGIPAALIGIYIVVRYFRHAFGVMYFLSSIIISIAAGAGVYYYIWSSYAHDNIAVVPIVYFAIFVLIVLLGARAMHRSMLYIVLFIVFIVSSLAAIGIAANNFYQYYPTVNSIFSTTDHKSLNDAVKKPKKKAAFVPLDKQNLKVPDVMTGSVFGVTIPGTISKFEARDAIVYLPPAYDLNPDADFPVVVLLSGYPGNPSDLTVGVQLQTTMDEFASKHKGLAPVVIIPDHNKTVDGVTGCVDSVQYGNVETYLTKDVVNYANQKLNVAADPQRWAIGGFSEGGMCAAMLTLRNPTVFHTFLNMSGESKPQTEDPSKTLSLFFGGDTALMQQHSDDYLLTKNSYKDISGKFIVGGADEASLVAQMQATYKLAKQKGLDVEITVVPGQGHTFELWAKGMKDSTNFINTKIGVISK